MRIANPKRIPRKLKKDIIKKNGRKMYKLLMMGHFIYKAHILSEFKDNKWVDRFIDHRFYIELKEN